jgi:hypothetical protein
VFSVPRDGKIALLEFENRYRCKIPIYASLMCVYFIFVSENANNALKSVGSSSGSNVEGFAAMHIHFAIVPLIVSRVPLSTLMQLQGTLTPFVC